MLLLFDVFKSGKLCIIVSINRATPLKITVKVICKLLYGEKKMHKPCT